MVPLWFCIHQIFSSCARMSHLIKENDSTKMEKYHSIFNWTGKRNAGERDVDIKGSKKRHGASHLAWSMTPDEQIKNQFNAVNTRLLWCQTLSS